MRKYFNYRNLIMTIMIALFAYTSFNLYNYYTKGTEMFFFGYRPLIISDNSMAPTFEKNDIVIIKQDDGKNLKEGDRVFFVLNDRFKAIETITKVSDEGFNVKQDSKPRNSSIFVDRKNVLGVGIFVLQTSILIKNPGITIFGILAVISVLYTLSLGVKMLKVSKKNKKEKKYAESETIHN